MHKILESTTVSEKTLANLPSDSLEDMLNSLQVRIAYSKYYMLLKQTLIEKCKYMFFQLILVSLKRSEKDLNILETSAGNNPNITDTVETMTQLKRKILDLILRSKSGIALITVS